MRTQHHNFRSALGVTWSLNLIARIAIFVVAIGLLGPLVPLVTRIDSIVLADGSTSYPK